MRPGHDRGLQSDRGAERPCAVRRRPSCPDRFGGGQMTAIPAFAVYAAAALAEIAGCFAVWAWMRPGASALWLLPCIVSLAAFAWALTLAPSDFAGRAYAAYGGVHIADSLGSPEERRVGKECVSTVRF